MSAQQYSTQTIKQRLMMHTQQNHDLNSSLRYDQNRGKQLQTIQQELQRNQGKVKKIRVKTAIQQNRQTHLSKYRADQFMRIDATGRSDQKERLDSQKSDRYNVDLEEWNEIIGPDSQLQKVKVQLVAPTDMKLIQNESTALSNQIDPSTTQGGATIEQTASHLSGLPQAGGDMPTRNYEKLDVRKYSQSQANVTQVGQNMEQRRGHENNLNFTDVQIRQEEYDPSFVIDYNDHTNTILLEDTISQEGVHIYQPELNIVQSEGYQTLQYDNMDNQVPSRNLYQTINNLQTQPKSFRVKSAVSRKKNTSKAAQTMIKKSNSKIQQDHKKRVSTQKQNIEAVREIIYADQNNNSPKKTQMIGAPQYHIENIKNKRKEMDKQNQNYREKIESSDQFHHKMYENTKDFKAKIIQCHADKVEIMRDLATYETNYSNSVGTKGQSLMQQLSNVLDKVKIARVNCQQQIKFDEEGEYFFTDASYSLNDSSQEEPNTEQSLRNNLSNKRIQTSVLQNQQKIVSNQYLKQKEVEFIFKQMVKLQNEKKNRFEAYQNFNLNLRQKLEDHNVKKKVDRYGKNILESQNSIDNQQYINLSDGKKLSALAIKDSYDSTNFMNSIIKNDSNEESCTKQTQKNMQKRIRRALSKSYGLIAEKEVHSGENSPLGKSRRQRSKNELVQRLQSNLISTMSNQEKSDEANDKFYGKMKISGVPCMVSAQFINRVIKGQLNCSLSSKNFKFDFMPKLSMKFQSIILQKELKRIYFMVKLSATDNKDSLYLRVQDNPIISQSIISETYGHFLIRLNGSMNKYNSITIDINNEQETIQIGTSISFVQNIRKQSMFKPYTSDVSSTIQFSDLPDYLFMQNRTKIIMDNLAKFIEERMMIQQIHISHLNDKGGEYAIVFKQHTDTNNSVIGTRSTPPLIISKFIQDIKNENNTFGDYTLKDKKVDILLHMDKSLYQSVDEGLLFQNNNNPMPMYDKYEESLRKQQKNIVLVSENNKAKFQQETFNTLDSMKHIPQNSFQKSGNLLTDQKYQQMIIRCRSSLNEIWDDKGQPSNSVAEAIHNQSVDNGARTCIDVSQNNSERKYPNKETQQTGRIDVSQIKTLETACGLKLNTDSNGDINMKQIIYIPDNDYMRLKQMKQANLERMRNEALEDEAYMKQYDLIYQVRLTKAHKRYTMNSQQKQKEKAFIKLRDKEQIHVAKELIMSFQTQIKFKTRKLDISNLEKKRKYYRQPKIFQNNYIDMLHDNGQVMESISVTDPDDENIRQLFLFVSERNLIYMLLGRQDMQNVSQNDENSINDKAPIDLQSESSEKDFDVKDDDDDSPYFLKITLDTMFLKLIEDINFKEPSHLSGRFEDLIDNKNFQEIVGLEIKKMFKGKENDDLTGSSSSDCTSLYSEKDLKNRNNMASLHNDNNNQMLQIAERINESSSDNKSNQNQNAEVIGNILVAKKRQLKKTLTRDSADQSTIKQLNNDDSKNQINIIEDMDQSGQQDQPLNGNQARQSQIVCNTVLQSSQKSNIQPLMNSSQNQKDTFIKELTDDQRGQALSVIQVPATMHAIQQSQEERTNLSTQEQNNKKLLIMSDDKLKNYEQISQPAITASISPRNKESYAVTSQTAAKHQMPRFEQQIVQEIEEKRKSLFNKHQLQQSMFDQIVGNWSILLNHN